ncbi:non-structural maintenance of chromosomes element 3 homolog [Gigantopelta aegis]|uniref:non-structural maintenance of chromosomes element 3 homolog n=1 Tax=Gigantopelta aegis TaxID=1735272 RepID=UPI001B88D15E|nr:non-structural maintenance of chromosomes element 3 homolog [Gigantopelta aegis]
MPSTSQTSRASGSQRHSSASHSQRTSSQKGQSATQSMTQADKAAAGINEDELEQKVTDLVQYMLIMWQKNIPIKKQEINKNVLKEHSKAFGHIMNKAVDKLAKVFGAKVVELQDKQKGSYILLNQLENDPEKPYLVFPDLENAKTGLLMVTLSLIFMNGNIMHDAELWHTLKKFGIDPSITHDVFGDVKKVITQEFVRQGFLEYVRQPNNDIPTYDFQWGQRAHLETSKKHCLHFVSQIYDMEPERWTSQYQDVLTEEGIESDNNVSTS